VQGSATAFEADLLTGLLPDILDTLGGWGEGASEPVARNVLSAVVAVEDHVMDLVVDVASAGEDESAVTEPGTDSTIDDDGKWDAWMATKWHSDQASRVVESRLDWVHASARGRSRVVGLVMEGVNVSVQKLAHIRNVRIAPRVNHAVHKIEVRLTHVHEEANPEQGFEG